MNEKRQGAIPAFLMKSYVKLFTVNSQINKHFFGSHAIAVVNHTMKTTFFNIAD
jgi:hypothetical protein